MLAHSPPLPHVIEYDYEDSDMAVEDEEGFTLAFQERDRVCRVRLRMPVPTLQKLITAISEEYPKLEYLIIVPSAEEDTSTIFTLPESFQAPHYVTLCYSTVPFQYDLDYSQPPWASSH
jgi:hypothetical protein